MPSTFAVAGQESGSSLADGAVTVTIPSGSNHAAWVQCWFNDMTVSGLTCSQGGATVTTHASGTGYIAFRVTGLSAGSATFTPTGTGSNDISVAVIVADGVDQATPLGTLTEEAVASATTTTASVTTPDGAMAACAFRTGFTTWTIDAGTQRGTVEGPSGYNQYTYLATRDRVGATTDITATVSFNLGRQAYVAFLEAAGGTALEETVGDTGPATDAVTDTLTAPLSNVSVLTIPLG